MGDSCARDEQSLHFRPRFTSAQICLKSRPSVFVKRSAMHARATFAARRIRSSCRSCLPKSGIWTPSRLPPQKPLSLAPILHGSFLDPSEKTRTAHESLTMGVVLKCSFALSERDVIKSPPAPVQFALCATLLPSLNVILHTRLGRRGVPAAPSFLLHVCFGAFGHHGRTNDNCDIQICNARRHRQRRWQRVR